MVREIWIATIKVLQLIITVPLGKANDIVCVHVRVCVCACTRVCVCMRE